jgi:hypothetical protein
VRLFGVRAEVVERGEEQWRVRIDPRFSGAATEYRAAWGPDLEGAEWRPFAPPLNLSLAAPDAGGTLYLQLRRRVTVAGADLEQRTRVRGVRLP